MTIKLNWKFFIKGFLALLGISFILGVSLIVISEVRTPVRVISWRPAQDSVYTCFIATKGDNKVVAMSCLDTSKGLGTAAPTGQGGS